MRKNRAPDVGRNVHPGPSSRGRNKRQGFSPFLRCKQCGGWNDSRRTAWANAGEGYSKKAGASPEEMVDRAGCSWCGSLNWWDGQPPVIQDDRRMPWKLSRRKF